MESDEQLTSQTILVMAFEGWNDAGESASGAVEYLLNAYDSREIGSIRSDDYYDLQSARPIQCTATGSRRIVWPQTTFYDLTVSPKLRLILGIGPEPNFHWKRYCSEVLHFAEDCDVDSIVSFGSMFADCPHTRELPVVVIDYDNLEGDDTTYNGPIGIPTVLGFAAAEMDFQAQSLWVSIPDYLGNQGCPEGSLRLFHKFETLVHQMLDEDELTVQAKQWLADAQMLMRYNDELAEYVHNLELRADSNNLYTVVSPQSAKRLVSETEEFLRKIDDASGNHQEL